MSEEYIEKKMHQLRELGKNHANAKKNLTKHSTLSDLEMLLEREDLFCPFFRDK